ncbi:NADPH-dependent aldehyde reductase-like protein [Citrus sinensis]|nr:NADPH-dependent aldehyde reductase-like protein [Citrus sinensis]
MATSTITRANQVPPSLPLEDRVAIVTGASRGIGRGIALHLASLGAKLVINYASNSVQADLVAAEINSACPETTPRAITVQADVSDESQASICVIPAGVMDAKHQAIANTSVEDFDKNFRVNTRGTFLCCREASNRVNRGGGGRIIVLSTSLVHSLKPNFGAYTASKAAIETMAKILAKELKGTSITVNCVAPGPVATDMFYAGVSEEFVKKVIEDCPMGRLGETIDVAKVVGFLASDDSEWVSGQVICVDGGYA